VRDGHHRGHGAGRGRRRGLRGLDMGGVGWNFDRGSGRRRVRRGDSYRLDGSALRDRRQRHGDLVMRRLDGRSGGPRERSSTGRRTLDMRIDPVGLARYRRHPKPGDHTEPQQPAARALRRADRYSSSLDCPNAPPAGG
jgi:hypothetical protein